MTFEEIQSEARQLIKDNPEPDDEVFRRFEEIVKLAGPVPPPSEELKDKAEALRASLLEMN